MYRICVFTSPTCSRCPIAVDRARAAAAQIDTAIVEVYDSGTDDGMAEGALESVLAAPTVIIYEGMTELHRWPNESPRAAEIVEFIDGR